MKGMKGKFLKKLRSIGQIGSLKHGRVLQMNASDGLLDPIPPNVFRTPSLRSLSPQEPDAIDVAEIMRDLGEDEEEEDAGPAIDIIMDKENIQPPNAAATKTMSPVKDNSERQQQSPLSELHKCSFRRPDLNSGSLFDPDLLAAFQRAVMFHFQAHEPNNRNRNSESLEKGETHVEDALLGFELRGPPPGGSESVVLYTTSIRGIRKTFEDCNRVRFLLGNLKINFLERDVSMHKEFREELWRILGGRVVPPRLFIKGRYIGGADEVLGLHEQGKLVSLLRGMPIDCSGGTCNVCGGVRFVLCFDCSGSRKIIADNVVDDDGVGSVRCPTCNENGLVICPTCCC
ncbi:uncharacterized protein At3g28850-like [Magnolia sinica]|uniref:uncharacterized protein At3g28850-like n=1 Tax=Magnolia sinica TaxID=86752 RepID=UPI00265A7821|nr:uncharacterized protein At3g28850-like [Magnolia sinica]